MNWAIAQFMQARSGWAQTINHCGYVDGCGFLIRIGLGDPVISVSSLRRVGRDAMMRNTIESFNSIRSLIKSQRPQPGAEPHMSRNPKPILYWEKLPVLPPINPGSEPYFPAHIWD